MVGKTTGELPESGAGDEWLNMISGLEREEMVEILSHGFCDHCQSNMQAKVLDLLNKKNRWDNRNPNFKDINRMVDVERESVRRLDSDSLDKHRNPNFKDINRMMDVERESVRREDSDSLDKHRILVQVLVRTQQMTDDITESGLRQYTTGYYMLDVLSGGVSTLPCTVQDTSSISCMVALRSRIYIFGKPINNSNAKKPSSSYFLDFTNSSKSNGWKRGRPLIRPQKVLELGCAVVLGGKMYFFGDFDFEVYDPTAKPKPNWRRVKSTPPGAHWLFPPVLADHKNDRIIAFFRNTSSIYAYYPFREQWECLVEGFQSSWFSYFDPVTLVDGVIYVHYHQLKDFFVAYDLATKQWLNVQVSPDAGGNYESYLPFYSYDSLLYLGNGILCLLASCYKNRQTDQIQTQTQTKTTLVHVVQFKVRLINNNDTKKVLVTPLSSQYYDLQSPYKVCSCLAL